MVSHEWTRGRQHGDARSNAAYVMTAVEVTWSTVTYLRVVEAGQRNTRKESLSF